MSILDKRLKALGISKRVLKNTRCPECDQNNPNCCFSVHDGHYHIVCSNCGTQSESDNFEVAVSNFNFLQSVSKSSDDTDCLLQELIQ